MVAINFTVVTDEQLFASVTVKLKVPAPTVNVPVPLYGDVPPLPEMVTDVVPPLQAIGAETELFAINAVG